MNNNLNEFISFANILADEAEKVIKKYFRKKIKIESKNDESPVTIADKETELKIRELISLKYPDHGILGEEYEQKNINSEYLWVIDPIDGTRNFIAGHKDFGTLIALLYKNEPIIGIINCPMHEERWLGCKGSNTLLNGKKVKSSEITSLEESYMCTSGLYFDDDFFRKGYEKILNETRYYRYGGDCYMYGMVASGLIEIVIEDTLKTHDYMALIPVINGAGGIITDKYGRKINLESDGSVVVSANKILHKKLIDIINE
jgi:histidinol phosphatase-like enzyme (inositol monophosphatase family)